MVRVGIETIVMAAGPVPSLIVLRERCSKSDSPAPLRSLSIQTGSFEAAAISRGIDSGRAERPITHDLLLDTVSALGAKLERIEIVRAETQAGTLRERRGSFIKMVVVSVLVAAICSRLRGTVGALGFSISTGLVIWGVVDAVMLTSQIKVLDKRAADMMRARDAAARIAAEAQEL